MKDQESLLSSFPFGVKVVDLFVPECAMQQFAIDVSTEGNCDVVNLSPLLAPKIKELAGQGLIHLFIAGSTASLTTAEFEPGLIKHDLPEFFQRLAPDNIRYEHETTWHDDNGHSHVRAALLGPTLTVPYSAGKLLTGQWQQVVLIDFDTSPRKRSIIVTVMT